MRSNTGYKRVRQFTLPAETVRHIWLPPRLSAVRDLLLPAETVVLGKKSRQEAESHGQPLQ